MYAVLFKAEIAELDDDYYTTTARMRALALERYGCKEFIACTEGKKEIAISYWDSLEQIQVWKKDPEHQTAQEKGKAKWYHSYQVQIVEILRDYGYTTPSAL